MPIRYLVVDGNVRETRETYRAALGHTPAEAYGEVLLASTPGKASFDVLCPADAGANLPGGSDIAGYDGVVLTGSALHLWKKEPETLRQIEFARAVYAAQVPFFGSCWGLQIAAVAAGGDVQKNPRGREIGFARRIIPNGDGAGHPMLEGRPGAFDAPCSHLDEVSTLPPDSTLLASNAVSRVQAAEFRYEGGTFWGVQYHPEFSNAVVSYLIDRRVDDLIMEGFVGSIAEKDQMIADYAKLEADPNCTHLAWKYGLGPDVTDTSERRTEIRNFIEKRVLKGRKQRAA